MRTLIALLALSATAVATAQPSISVTPATVELGRVGPTRVETTVVLANNGSDTLRIERLSASCGCTTAKFAARALAPGDTAHVAVGVDARNRNGDVRTSITVTSNDPTSPGLVVPVHATVVRAVTMQEFLGPAPDAKLDAPHELTLQLRNVSDAPLRLRSPHVDKADGVEIVAGFEEIVIPAGEGRNIPIAVTAKKTGTGSGTLTIATDNPLQPQLAVGIYTNVAADSRTTAKHD